MPQGAEEEEADVLLEPSNAERSQQHGAARRAGSGPTRVPEVSVCVWSQYTAEVFSCELLLTTLTLHSINP